MVAVPPLAAKLRGSLSYAEGQLFGKVAAVGMVCFRKRAAGKDMGPLVTQMIADELDFMMHFLTVAVPRTPTAAETRPPLLIYTDASLEDGDQHAGVGAVLIDRDTQTNQFYVDVMSQQELKKLQNESEKVINSWRCWQSRPRWSCGFT